jgi:predicted membrane channel-forming protein YqfA (hemolysin III family)
MKYTGYLHIIALVVAIWGTIKQLDDVKANKPTSIWLSLSLAIMLILRIPNQICVATIESHGWYSVLGTMMGALSFLYLTYETYKHGREKNNFIE